MEYKEGDIILCTVKSIDHTTVFAELPDKTKGTLIISEISPGRIKNLRQYVVPKKKIVCKILRVMGEHIDLSLRRVTSKEKKEVMSKFKQEQTAKSAIHSIIKNQAEEIETKILKDFPSRSDFFLAAKEDEKLIDKYIPKEFHKQIKRITQKKQKNIQVTKIIRLKCPQPDGIKIIKKILEITDEKAKMTYLSAGKFQLNYKAENYKIANKAVDLILQEIEQKAKKESCEFSVEDKK